MKTQNQYNKETENNFSNLETKIIYLSDKIKPGHLKKLCLLYSPLIITSIVAGTICLLKRDAPWSIIYYSLAATITSDAIKNSTEYKAHTLYGIIKKWGNTTYKKR